MRIAVNLIFTETMRERKKSPEGTFRCNNRDSWRNWNLRGIFEILTLKSLHRLDSPDRSL